MVAERFGLEHHELHVRGDRLEEILEMLVSAHDEPFADAANIPLFLLARELRGSIKVVLQGDGGDELFGGYRRYAILQSAALWRLWPHAMGAPPGGKRDPSVIEPYRPIDDGAALNRLQGWTRDRTELERILVHNPARLYDF
jgi:asparagine synthetase B (glutamine-hydrolysing)